MKLICPKCQYTGLVDASADEGVTCARCGTLMDQLVWTGPLSSPLTTATAVTTTTAAAVIDPQIMNNQNAYAPGAEQGFDDVLEIPRPLLQSTQHAGEQTLVLEDVIAVPPPPDDDLSAEWEDEIEPDMLAATPYDELSPEGDEDESLPHAALRTEESAPQSRAEILGAAQASTVDYEGYRAWVRIAPLLLLVGALVFFTLYYLGNRMGEGERAQNAAANPATPDNAASAIPATSPASESAESAAPAVQPTESSVVGAKAESPSPAETSKVETAKTEAPPVTAAAPAPSVAPSAAPAAATQVAPPVVVASPAPVAAASQGTGNYTIQVGSYNSAAQAEERVSRLNASGIEARVVKAEIPRRGTWYRVQAGRFASHEEAARYGAQIKGKGATDDFIVTGAQSQ